MAGISEKYFSNFLIKIFTVKFLILTILGLLLFAYCNFMEQILVGSFKEHLLVLVKNMATYIEEDNREIEEIFQAGITRRNSYGTLVAVLDPKLVQQQAISNNLLGHKLGLILMNNKGQVLLRLTDPNFKDTKILEKFGQSEVFKRIRVGIAGTEIVELLTESGRKEGFVIAYAPVRVGSAYWIIVSGLSYDEVISPLRNIAYMVFFVFLVLFGTSVLGIRFIRRNLIKIKEKEKQALMALNNSIRVIGSPLEIHPVLEAILDEVNGLFKTSMSTIYRLDEKEQMLNLVSYRGFNYLYPPEGKITTRHYLFGRAVQEKRVVATPKISINEVKGFPAYKSINSIMAAPLIYQDKVIGVLTTYFKEERKFSEEEEKGISTLADNASIAIEHARLYAKSLHLQEKIKDIAIMEERNRLARELHDSLSQSLFSLAYLTEAALNSCENGSTKGVLAQIKEITQDAQRDMRGLIFELHPQSLVEKGLVFALSNVIEQFKRGNNTIQIDFLLNLSSKLPQTFELGLYRILQEALTNIRKHAEASEILIKLGKEKEFIYLFIEDNGKGFEPEYVAKGGLLYMKERIETLNGTFRFWSQPSSGTKLWVQLPLEEGDNE